MTYHKAMFWHHKAPKTWISNGFLPDCDNQALPDASTGRPGAWTDGTIERGGLSYSSSPQTITEWPGETV